jgi:hypothetical protein
MGGSFRRPLRDDAPLSRQGAAGSMEVRNIQTCQQRPKIPSLENLMQAIAASDFLAVRKIVNSGLDVKKLRTFDPH